MVSVREEGPKEIHESQAIAAASVKRHREDMTKPDMVRLLSRNNVKILRRSTLFLEITSRRTPSRKGVGTCLCSTVPVSKSNTHESLSYSCIGHKVQRMIHSNMRHDGSSLSKSNA